MNWTLLENSLLVTGGATLLATWIGFAAALWMSGLGQAWRKRILLAAVIALVMPPFLVTNCWLHFLGLTGVWRGWLPLNIYSLGGAIWILALLTWPIPLLAALSAWQRLEPAQLESDPALRGAALVRWLLWPMARASLGQAIALAFVLTLNNFAVPAILQIKVFPAEVWVRFSTNFDSAGALVLSWPLIVAPLLLLSVLRRTEILWPLEQGVAAAQTFRRQLGAGLFFGCGSVSIMVLLLSVALPLAQILAVERTWMELPNVLRAVPGVIWNSLAYAAVAASAGIVLSLVIRREHWKGSPRFSWSSLLWLPLLVPGVLLGIGMIAVFNRPMFEGIYQSAGIVLIAWTVRYLALGWNGVGMALQSVDPDLTDAARLSGASGWLLLRHVHWPQMAPQVGAVWYVTYLLCLWDVETLILICPPGGETLALRIFNLLHYGHNAQVNALCLLLLGLAIVPLGIWGLGRRLAAWRNGP